MILITIFYAFVGWLVGMYINHLANILPTRQTLHRWPLHSQAEAPSYLDWSVLLTLLTKGTSPLQIYSRRVFIRLIVVELTTPAFFIFLLNRYGFTFHLALISLYTAILLLITVTDLEHRLIFNVVILPSILLSIVAAFFTPNLPWPSALVGGLAGFIIMYLAFLLARGGLGEGDVTLFTFQGFILGFPYILLNLFFGVFLAGFIVTLLLITRQVTMKTYIPYGPFLTITGWIMLIWGEEIWQYYFW